MSKRPDITWELTEPSRYVHFWYGRFNRLSARGKLEQKLDKIPRLKRYEYGGVKEYDEIKAHSEEHLYLAIICAVLKKNPSLHLGRAGKQFLYYFKHDPAVFITIIRDKDGKATYEGLSLSTPDNIAAFEDIADKIGWDDRKATKSFCNRERRISNSVFDYYDANASEKAKGMNLSRTDYLNGKLYHDFLMRRETNGIESDAQKIARKMGMPIKTARKYFPDTLFGK